MEIHFFFNGLLIDNWENYPYIPQLQSKVRIQDKFYVVNNVVYSNSLVTVELE